MNNGRLYVFMSGHKLYLHPWHTDLLLVFKLKCTEMKRKANSFVYVYELFFELFNYSYFQKTLRAFWGEISYFKKLLK